jgi:hypothetical protein
LWFRHRSPALNHHGFRGEVLAREIRRISAPSPT